MSLEEQKKLLLPFLQRAEEVQKAEPKIAYYCRLYAVEQALQIPKDERLPEINGLLGALLGKLEKDRGVMQLSTKEDSLYCENFALTIFNRADRADRAGRADKTTALTFYAASFFMEILNQFGELPPDVLARQRYAAWRAAEIRKAMKEGRAPAPPPAANKEEVSPEDQDFMDSLAPAPSATSSDAPYTQPPGAPPSPPFDAPSPPFISAPSGGGQEGGSSHGAYGGSPGSPSASDRLPSPPKRQLSKQMSTRDSAAGAAWVAPPPRAFYQFQKVLYFTEGGAPPQLGTIAKIEASAGEAGTPPTYYVALKDRIVQAEPGQLALSLSKGDRVAYYAPHGQRESAVVEEVDTGHWPPSYVVHVDGGSFVETIDDRLEPLEMTQAPEEELEKLRLEQQAQQQAQQAAGVPTHPPPPPAATAQPPQPPGLGAPPHGGLHAPPAPPSHLPHPNAYPPPPFGPPPAAPSRHSATPMQQPPAASPPAQQRRAPAPAPGPAPSAGLPAPAPGYEPSLATVTEAQRQCKMAMSALSFEDIPTALRHLGDAFKMLSQPQHAPKQQGPGGGRR